MGDGRENDAMLQYLTNLSHLQANMEQANRDMTQLNAGLKMATQKADSFRISVDYDTDYESSEESVLDKNKVSKLEQALNRNLNLQRRVETKGGFCSIFKCLPNNDEEVEYEPEENSMNDASVLIQEYLRSNIRAELKRKNRKRKKKKKHARHSTSRFAKLPNQLSLLSESRLNNGPYIVDEVEKGHKIFVDQLGDSTTDVSALNGKS